jgi:ankyrin repeat protein
VTLLLEQGAQANSEDKDGFTPFMMACQNGQIDVVKVLLEHVGTEALQETDIQGMTALHIAASWDNKEIVSFLLEQGAQADSRDEDGATPFMLACKMGHMGVVKMLLEHMGPQAFQETDTKGRTALHFAASCGKDDIVSFLLGQGAQANSRDEDGTTPSMIACEHGQIGVARVLLQHVGPEALQETDEYGRTALHFAAFWGHGETAIFLLGQGAQANSRDEGGMTPFMWACEAGHMGVVKMLLEHMGPQAFQETDEHGLMALHYAASCGKEETVSFLLGQGAQANSRAEEGITPFMLACEEGRIGVARILLQHVGPQALQETDQKGRTVVHAAADRGHEDMLTFLISEGAQANSRDEYGYTPFMLAFGEGHMGVVKVLLQHVGPEALQETNEQGMTALHYAAWCGKEEIVSFLLGQGAQADSRDEDGTTPFISACDKGHMGVVRLLLQHVGPEALQETDTKGRTALHFAAKWGHEDIVTFLLGQGAQANSRDDVGTTPLMWACINSRTGVVQMLVQHMGKQAVQETDNGGITALHFAAYWGHEETAAFLISQGAECSSRTARELTPLMFACDRGRLGVVRLLLQHVGPEALHDRDERGKLALHWACEKGHGEIVRALLVGGADPTVTDHAGRTPRAIAEMEEEDEEEDDNEDEEEDDEKGRWAGCVAQFEVR